MELLLPLAVFVAFLAFFAVQARREGTSIRAWLADKNAATTYSPGWWKPAAALITVIVAIFVAYLTITQGFRWAYLLVIPIFGGFFAASAAVLFLIFRRNFSRH